MKVEGGIKAAGDRTRIARILAHPSSFLVRPFPCAVLLIVGSLSRTAGAAEPAQPSGRIEAAKANLGRPVDYEKDVAPIFDGNCVACHNAGTAESKLNLENAEGVRKGGRRGQAIVPNKPDASLLIMLASRSKQPAMPPLPNKVEASALTPAELGILRQWILEGAKGGGGSAADAIQWQPIPAGMKSIQSVALSPWARFAAVARTNQVFVYDLVRDRESARLADPALADLQFDGRPMYPGGAADRDFIHAVAFSPDGTLIAAAGYRVVKIWKRPHQVERLNVALPSDATAIAATRDGSLIAVATADHSIRLFKPSKGVSDASKSTAAPVSRKLDGPTATVTALQFSSDGKTLYAGSQDKVLRAWSVETGVQQRTVKGIALLAVVAPVSKELKQKNSTASQSIPTRLISGSNDGTILVSELESGKFLTTIKLGGPMSSIAVSPDGRFAASAGNDHRIRLWRIADGKSIAELKGELPAERLLITRTESQAIAGQHVETAEARVKAAEQEFTDRNEGAKKEIAAKAAVDKTLSEAKAKEKTAADAVAAAQKALQGKASDPALKKKVDEAKKALATAEQTAKTAADIAASATRAKEAADQALEAAKQRVAESKAGKEAALSAKAQADKHLAEAKTAAAARDGLTIRSLAFSSDGNTLASADADSVIQLWDVQSGRALEAFRAPAAKVGSSALPLAFLGSSTQVSTVVGKQLLVWETNPPWTLVARIGTRPDAPLDVSGSPFTGRVLSLAFNHEGTLLATGGGEPSRSGELKIWNVPAFTLARDLKDAHSDTVFGIEFSRDGKYLASCAADKFVKVFGVANGKLVRSLEGHTHHVLGVTWKADGSILASAGADNQIKVWNFESGEQVRSIVGYGKQVTSIQFIGTGDEIVSSGGDKTVRLHRTGDGSDYRTFGESTDYVYSAAASRDQSIIAAGGEDGTLRVWNGTNGQKLLTFPPPAPTQDSTQDSTHDSTQASAGKR